MEAVKFDGSNVVLGEGQPHVLPLPAHRGEDPEGTITTCYELTPEERAAVAANGKIWLQQWTFGQPLQPQRPSVYNPIDEEAAAEEAKITEAAT